MVSNLYMVFCGMDPLFYFFKLFIYFWLCCIFTAARGFFKLRLGGGVLLRYHEQASHCSGFSCCKAQASGHAGFSSCDTCAQKL